jgi:hypothetical protein
VMILDAYTHVAYVCRRHHGVEGTRVQVKFDPNKPPANDDSDVVKISTPTAWVIIRVLVESPADLNTARSLQRSISVTAPVSHPNDYTERAGRPTAICKAGADFFTELNGYVKLDPPAPCIRNYLPKHERLLMTQRVFLRKHFQPALKKVTSLLSVSMFLAQY